MVHQLKIQSTGFPMSKRCFSSNSFDTKNLVNVMALKYILLLKWTFDLKVFVFAS